MSFKSKMKGWIKSYMMMRKEQIIRPIVVPTDPDKLLSGKVSLITGGSSGIGLAIAEKILLSGGKVVIAGTNQNKLDNAVNRLSAIRGGIARGLSLM